MFGQFGALSSFKLHSQKIDENRCTNYLNFVLLQISHLFPYEILRILIKLDKFGINKNYSNKILENLNFANNTILE